MIDFVNFYISFLGKFLIWFDPISPIVLVPLSLLVLSILIFNVIGFVYGR